MKNKYRKTKKQRQQWWNSLTPEEQALQIEKWQAQKKQRRLDNSVRAMRKYAGKYSCETCLHGKNNHCTDHLVNACEYWFNPQSKIQGLAYKYPIITDIRAWLNKIKAKNPWLKVA